MPRTPKFDPSADYKATAYFRFAGVAITPGTQLDKTRLSDEERDRVLERLYQQRKIDPMSDEEVEQAGGPSDQLTDAQAARVKELVDGNNRDELDLLAAGEPYKIVDPDKLPNKEAVATAIVRAEAAAA